jgi:hypothetical protein
MWCRRPTTSSSLSLLGKLAELPVELGKADALLADNGYFSESNVNACAAAGIDPMIAMGRIAHHPTLDERLAAPPPSPPKDPTPLEAMDHRLKTPAGKTLYALRKQIPELVFSIIKSALGFQADVRPGGRNLRPIQTTGASAAVAAGPRGVSGLAKSVV